MSSPTTDPAADTVAAPAGVDPAAAVQQACEIDLAVGGMTCAACAARIEKKLNRMDGVRATVNFATETAHVTFPAGLDPPSSWRPSSAPGTPRNCRRHRLPPSRSRGPSRSPPPRIRPASTRRPCASGC